MDAQEQIAALEKIYAELTDIYQVGKYWRIALIQGDLRLLIGDINHELQERKFKDAHSRF